jgi:hypothetical protein
MSNVENLEDHMAFACDCGCVGFNLLKSGGLECESCGTVLKDCSWGKAIEQAQKQEPVAWMYVNTDGECEQIEYGKPIDDPSITLLYTSPPQRPAAVGEDTRKEWVGLTQTEVVDLLCEYNKLTGNVGWQQLIYMTEAKLKEKNT